VSRNSVYTAVLGGKLEIVCHADWAKYLLKINNMQK